MAGTIWALRRLWVFTLILLAKVVAVKAAEPLPIVDAHVHCVQDAWEKLPPPHAIALLRKQRNLSSLPRDLAERSAYRNGDALVPPKAAQ